MNERLLEYLKKHIEKDSDMEKVKQALIRAGHDIKIVEEHVNQAIENQINKKQRIRKHVAISIIGLAAAVILFIAFYFFPYYKKTDLAVNETQLAEINLKNLESFNQALITNDTDICDKIEGSALKNECKRKFEDDLNKTEEKISFNETADKKSFNMALINHNASICLEITDDSLKNQCGQILMKKE